MNTHVLLKWAGAAVLIFAGVLAGCANESCQVDYRDGQERLKVLFLGDDGGHEPAVRLRDVARPMLDRGIELFYTSDLGDINLENLRRYDAVLHYANYHEPHYPETDAQMIADLVQYVEEGGGFVPVHSASGNFRASQDFISWLGGALASNGWAPSARALPRLITKSWRVLMGLPAGMKPMCTRCI